MLVFHLVFHFVVLCDALDDSFSVGANRWVDFALPRVVEPNDIAVLGERIPEGSAHRLHECFRSSNVLIDDFVHKPLVIGGYDFVTSLPWGP